MDEKKVFEILYKNDIKFVLIGGNALFNYGSTRVTYDTDIAVKTIDLEKIPKLLYSIGFKIMKEKSIKNRKDTEKKR
ncbi:MAG TPA: hypothetical protein PLM75_04620 [bacterium]|nr:hypothetical protein [bacterium]HPP87127.1 hypothetical protein [bacterium]